MFNIIPKSGLVNSASAGIIATTDSFPYDYKTSINLCTLMHILNLWMANTGFDRNFECFRLYKFSRSFLSSPCKNFLIKSSVNKIFSASFEHEKKKKAIHTENFDLIVHTSIFNCWKECLWFAANFHKHASLSIQYHIYVYIYEIVNFCATYYVWQRVMACAHENYYKVPICPWP